MKKYFGITIAVVGILGLFGYYQIFTNSKEVQSVSPEQAVEEIRRLPEVQKFVADVEKKSSERRVSYRSVDSTDNEHYIVIVAETDDTKETVWKRFFVNKKNAQILLENSLTGELESY